MRTIIASGVLALFTLVGVCAGAVLMVYLWLQLVTWVRWKYNQLSLQYWGWRFRRAVNRKYPEDVQPLIHLIRKAQK